LWILLAAATLLVPSARAQGPYPSRQLAALRGTKVRLHTYGGEVQGVVQGVRDDDLLLRRSSYRTDELPVAGILRVEVYSRDRGGTVAGMTLGGGLGLGLGVGVASWLDSIDDEPGLDSKGMVLLGSLGTLVGAALGAHLMGSVWTPLPPQTPQLGFEPRQSTLTVSCAWRF
jgi:hypothetical protein